jgi:succinate dehydrogenase/fumarate reductase iron-sulfur protein
MARIHKLIIKIRRFDPDTNRKWIQEYRLEAGPILRFTDLFRKINNEFDATLAWNSSCEHAQCGTCAVLVNRKPLLACELIVDRAIKYFGTTTFLIEPLGIAPVLRDLVVDLEKAYKKIHQIKPYIISPSTAPVEGQEHLISPRMMDRYVEATRCINCFCCVEACISSHRGFIGPNAVLASLVRLLDVREQAKQERLEQLFHESGIYRCHSSRACSFVCPKEIDVAHFIAMAKEARFGADEN